MYFSGALLFPDLVTTLRLRSADVKWNACADRSKPSFCGNGNSYVFRLTLIFLFELLAYFPPL